MDDDGAAVMAGAAGGDFGLFKQYGTSVSYWGQDGGATVDFDGRTDVAYAVAHLPNDAVVAAGGSSGDVAVYEVDDQAFPSTTFGASGRVLTDLGGADDAAYGVVPLDGGSLVVAGGNATTGALLRYLPNGALDPAFGVNGIVRTPAPGPWRAMARQPDGKLVVVGGGGGAGVLVARYLPDGALDPGFGTNGQVQALVGPQTVANAVDLMYNGTIVAAGGRNGDIAVVRVSAAGGVLAADVYDLGGMETAYGVAVNALGVATVVGERDSAGFAAAYLADGSPDTELSPTGTVLVEMKLRGITTTSGGDRWVVGSAGANAGYTRFVYQFGRASFFQGHTANFAYVATQAYRALRQPDGRIVVAGSTSGMIALVRYNPSGALDATFGYGGRTVSDLIAGPYAHVGLDLSGRILVTGSYRNELAIIRLGPNGRLDTTYGTGGRSVPAIPGPWSTVGGMAVLPDGSAYVLGSSNDTLNDHAFVVRLAATGAPIPPSASPASCCATTSPGRPGPACACCARATASSSSSSPTSPSSALCPTAPSTPPSGWAARPTRPTPSTGGGACSSPTTASSSGATPTAAPTSPWPG